MKQSRHGGTAKAPAAARGYTATAKTLHWLIALLVVAMIPMGLVMKRGGLGLGDRIWLYQLHKSIGLTVLVLMAVRIVWRLTHRPPPFPEGMPRMERAAAGLVHLALYGLLVALPVCGWVMVSAAALPVPTRVFWVVPVPHWPGLDELAPPLRGGYETVFKDLHLALAIGLGILALLHAAAALHHHFGRRDDVLRRMLPWRFGGLGRGGTAAISAVLFAAMLDAVPGAQAQEPPTWRIDPARSSLNFEASAGLQAVKGRFERFRAQIHFDPEAPTRAGFAVAIETGSATTGTSEIDAALKSSDWFDATRHPMAVFGSARGERLPDGRYRMHDELTLKGRSHPLPLDFRLAVEGNRASAIADLVIDRLAFDVGPSGPIAGLVIANDVKVRIVIEAERENAK